MRNGWTGGQYSVYRGLFGAYLFVHFVHLSTWGAEVFSSQGILPDGSVSPLLHAFPNVFALFDGPVFVVAVLIAAAGLSLLFAVGKWDRMAAVLLWYIWACLFGRNPLIANPGLPYVGWLLLAHAFLPAAPFGSWAARGRVDPRGTWSMTPAIYAVAWALMALGYSYSGYTKLVSPSWLDGSAFQAVLSNPLARPTFLREWMLALPPLALQLATWGALGLELLYAPLAIFRRVRPWIWIAMVGLHLGLIVLIDFADLTAGMLLIHLFTFNPAWIRAKRASGADTIFYDGTCALCHGTVRLVLAEDATGEAFRLAPLDSDAYRSAFSPEVRESLPDSVVVLSDQGTVLERSDGVARILARLGGMWRFLAWLLVAIPHPVRDLGYRGIAAIRYRIFGRTVEACPILSPEYRRRWLE